MRVGWPDRGAIAQFLVVLMVFSLVLPTAAINFTLLLLLIAYLVQGEFLKKWIKIRAEPVAMASLLLLGMFVFSLLYTPVNLSDALIYLNKYHELLLLPIMVSIVETERWKKRAYYTFLVAITLMVFISYARYWGWLSPSAVRGNHPWVPLSGHITYSFLLSYGIYLMVHHAVQAQKRETRTLWILLALISAIDLLFLIGSRTGYVVLLALFGLLVVQYRHHGKVSKGWPLMLLGLAVVVASVVMTSPAMQGRAKDLQLMTAAPESSSLGQRLIFWEVSLKIIGDAPLLGSGVSSFQTEYAKHNLNHPDLRSDNPHNEYLLIASQLGLLGLAAFIWLLVVQYRRSVNLPPRYRFAAQGLVVAMAVGCIFNSFLRDHAEGHFFAVWAGLLFAPVRGETET